MTENEVDMTERLIRGTKNIDRMRADIHQVITMLIGFVKEPNYSSQPQRNISEIFSPQFCSWRVLGQVNCHNHLDPLRRQDPDTLIVECWIESDRVYCSMARPDPLKFDVVQAVYNSLPALVAGMLKVLPELEQKIAPFLDAADAFQETRIRL